MKTTFRTTGILLGAIAAFGFAVSASSATNFVAAQGFSFSPKDLTIGLGDTIVFTGGNNIHTVTGDGAEPFCGTGLFTMCSVTFSTGGTFPYHCIPHVSLGMTGVVHVVAAVRSPLTVIVHGEGRALPDLNGQELLVGVSYTITASPAMGFTFTGWTGGVSSTDPRLTFVMEPNLVLEANFVPNPLQAAGGSYNGLFYVNDPINGVQHESSGAFSFRLMTSGKYSGQLQLAGKRLPFAGQLDSQGKATNAVKRVGTTPLSVELMLDLTGSDQVTGRVVNPAAGWIADLMGDRAPVYGRTNSSPYRGNYTLVVTKDDGTDGAGLTQADPELEIGDGFGTLKVDAKGKLTFRATLADGTPVSQSAPVSKAGLWPLYLALYGGKGSILSWVSLSTNPAPEDSVFGELSWIKPASTGARYYAAGFTNQMDIVGSIYQPPGTNKVLQIDMGTASFDGGNLTAALTNVVRLEPNNKLKNLTTNQPLVVNIALPTGLFSGSVKAEDGGVKKTLMFKGALLQHQNLGAGFFLSTNKSGTVRLESAP
jgi:uncharacterized repeat protein (TIGR02543 family)